MNRAVSRRSVVAGAAALSLAGRMAGPVAAASPKIPATRAGKQLAWVIEQLEAGGDGLTTGDIAPRFSDDFLTGLDAGGILATFQSYASDFNPTTIARFEGGVTEQHANALVSTPSGYWRINVGLEFTSPYRINDFYFEQVEILTAPDRPRSWSGLLPYFKSIAPHAAYIAGEITDSGFTKIAAYNEETSYPIASSFKLFVLGTMAALVANGDRHWDDTITISDSLRSLPSGNLYYAPAGAEYPLEYVVERMIAESDNTAADHSINHAGREVIEEHLSALGHSHPDEMTPLMYTREWFAMRINFDEKQVSRYVDANIPGRRTILQKTVDPLANALLETDPWPGPEDSDKIEWFASVSDLARVVTNIQIRSQAPATAVAGNALSLEPGLMLDPSAWQYVGFKEGYETGLKVWSFLLQRRDGRWFVLVTLIHDPKEEIDGPALHPLIAAAAQLLAEQT